jgi:hypothetical protein
MEHNVNNKNEWNRESKREDWKTRSRVVSEVTLRTISVFVRARSPAQRETSLQSLNSHCQSHKHWN